MISTISKTFERTLPDGRVFIATAQLQHLQGNARPYFSLTGEEWQTQRHLTRHRNSGSEAGMLCCGAMGETLVEVFPELAPFAVLHLADDTGAPLHAIENGWYWYAQDHDAGAHYLRVEPAEMPYGMTREQFEVFAGRLAPQWQREADAALEMIK